MCIHEECKTRPIYNFEKAIKINSNFFQAYNNLGLAFKEKGELRALKLKGKNLPSKEEELQMLSKQTLPPIQNLVGTMYNNNQYVPPQLEPRPLSRIGNQWRSGQ